MKKASTLLELIIGMAIFGFITGAVFLIFSAGQNSYFTTSKKLELQIEGRKSLDIITHKIYNSNISTFSYLHRKNSDNLNRDILSLVEYKGFSTINTQDFQDYYTIFYASLNNDSKTGMGKLHIINLKDSTNTPKALVLNPYTNTDPDTNPNATNKRTLTKHIYYTIFSIDYLKNSINIKMQLKNKIKTGAKFKYDIFEINSTLTPKQFYLK